MKKLFNLLFLIFMIVIFMTPIAVIFSNSFMKETELNMNYSTSPNILDKEHKYMKLKLIPEEFSLKHYIDNLFLYPPFLIFFSNSVKILIPILIFNIIISIFSAYGFYIWEFKYKNLIFNLYIIIMLLPIQAVIVPNFLMAQKLGILNTHLAVILPNIFSPFGAFLLYQSLRAIPYEYIEAGKLDGAGNSKILFYIIVPQIKSAITALTILVFIENWNLVEQVITLIQDAAKEPLSLFLSRISEYSKGTILSASCIYMIVPIWIVLYFQEDLQSGIELSGIK